ncbi:MAG: glycerol-3-phosphate acyltransferase [Chloroflexota bacterium]|nr:glycerol-3-phosphate acyltransferase [Chloroflexota bacterium]
MIWQAISLLIGAYFVGSIPTAYLAGRWLRGIDVRQHGTGNVGGSNVWHSVARWAVVPVGLFDVGKAALPAWLALGALDLGYPVAVAAGLCAAVGHAWSLYLGFTGGRALGCILGTLAVVFPQGALIQLLVMGVGFVLHAVLLTTLGLLALPPLSLVFGQPPAVTWGCVAAIVLTAVKRVDANRTPLPPGPDRGKVIWRRLWLDRDIASHEAWVSRGPAEIQPDEGQGNGRCVV